MNDDTNKPVLDWAGIGDGVLGLLRALLGAVLKPGNCMSSALLRPLPRYRPFSQLRVYSH